VSFYSLLRASACCRELLLTSFCRLRVFRGSEFPPPRPASSGCGAVPLCHGLLGGLRADRLHLQRGDLSLLAGKELRGPTLAGSSRGAPESPRTQARPCSAFRPTGRSYVAPRCIPPRRAKPRSTLTGARRLRVCSAVSLKTRSALSAMYCISVKELLRTQKYTIRSNDYYVQHFKIWMQTTKNQRNLL